MAWGRAHGFLLLGAPEVLETQSLQASDGSDGKAARLCWSPNKMQTQTGLWPGCVEFSTPEAACMHS